MSPAQFIVWNDNYSVGNRELDDHHKAIVSIINDLYVAIQEKSARARLNEILDRLSEYTESHFRREEELMDKLQYPGTPHQKSLHTQMVQKTNSLRKSSACLKDEVARDALSFLKDWWLHHIVALDSQYKPYMEGKEGNTPG